MAITAVTHSYDVAMRTLAYTRFGSILGINTLAPQQADAINLGVVICPKGIAQREIAEKRGETFLEFINIYPSRFGLDWSRNRTNVSRRGIRYQKSDGTIGVYYADALDLKYDMWFWSSSLDKIRLCMEKYVQWQHEVPKVSFIFGVDTVLDPDIKFGPVVDISTIEDIFDTGKIWVYKMTATIEAWLPKSGSDEQPIHKIRLSGYDKDDLSNYRDIVINGSSQNTELANALRMFRASLYGITGVNSAAKTFTVAKDRESDFVAGTKFRVENSSDNNEIYTIISSTYSAAEDKTIIAVQESPVSNIVDGNIYLHEGTN